MHRSLKKELPSLQNNLQTLADALPHWSEAHFLRLSFDNAEDLRQVDHRIREVILFKDVKSWVSRYALRQAFQEY